MANQDSERSQMNGLKRRAATAPLLDAAQELELLRRIRESGDSRALETLIESHLRLVMSVASRFARSGIPFGELVSEGTLGLVEAARRFDASKNARYATYAAWWVRSYIGRFALSNRNIVSGPSTRNARLLYSSLRAAERQIEQETGERATREAIAAATKTTPEDVELVQLALSRLDAPIGTDEGAFEPTELAPSPEEALASCEDEWNREARVRSALERLDARERQIVARRYLADEEATLASIGVELGLSRERVRQIECKAKQKLRQALLEVAA